jgi:hypothetical protein
MPTARKPVEHTITVIMISDKETTNTVRFKEVPEKGKAPILGTLYVPKYTLEELDNPDAIEITIRGN